jgi:hypothetical protein
MTTRTPSADRDASWPSLTFADWRDTYASLHMRTQIVGKTRLALAPMQNHWWQVALYLTSRGLTTSPMPYEARTIEVEFDFFDHRLLVRASDGTAASMPLAPQAVADFYEEYLALLGGMGVEVRLWPVPVEIAGGIPFHEDRQHVAYDGAAAQRCWRVLTDVDRVLKEFRGPFLGKCSPSHFWWGGFDIACTRFSGQPAPRHPGGIPALADWVTREAYSHACISAGWWPGTAGMFEESAFYAYAYPEPAGCAEAPVRPEAARYDVGMREWILPYEAVRTAADPDAALLDFLQSTYQAAATLGSWDRAALERHEVVGPTHAPAESP